MKARYAAFGLMGLTAYSVPLENAEHAAAMTSCVTWLQRHVLADGLDVEHYGHGWSEHPKLPRVSVLSTSIAALALDRVPIGTPGAARSRELASKARRRLRSIARGNAERRWWPVRTDVHESLGERAAGPAVTGLAVLALAAGGSTSQAYARAGARWLLENARLWERTREPEESVPDANWVHPSSLLCLRAVLVPCAGVDPQRRELATAIAYLDDLWSDQAGEWLNGHPSSEVSTSADLHAASAIRALRRSWRGFDPVEHVLGGRTRRLTAPAAIGGDKPFEVRWEAGILTVLSADGSLLVRRSFAARATAMRAILDALSARWLQAGMAASHRDRSLSAEELRAATSINNVYEYVRRLNLAVGESSRSHRGRSCVLVQRIETGEGIGRDRYALLGARLIVED